MQSNNSSKVNISFIQSLRHSKLRFALWPIRSYELTKFLSMAFLMFFILLNQNLVRNIKDGFVVTMISTEIISFIKLWGEAPMGILFVIIYSKMANIMTTEKIFRIILGFFLLFFSFFAFAIFPNQSLFLPSADTTNHYIALYPHLKWFVVMWANWCLVLFYIMGELWPVVIFSLLFWQLANKITASEEASRFYVLFGLFGQSNLLVSGLIIVYFSSGSHIFMPLFSDIANENEILLKSLTLMMMVSGAVILMLHRFIEVRSILGNKNIKFKSQRTDILKLGLRESAKMVLKSKYLAIICVLIICYATAFNLIEGLWMSRTKALYPVAKDFMNYNGRVYFWTGISSISFIFVGGFILRVFGWVWAAIITPAVVMLFGCIFFSFVLIEDQLSVLLEGITTLSPLLIIVIVGGMQNVFGKGAKYSLFDATKEMVYIPLDKEMKVKGKASADIIGVKLGKSVGASLQFLTFTIFPMANHEDIAGFLMTIFCVVCIVWLFSVITLSKEYKKYLAAPKVVDK